MESYHPAVGVWATAIKYQMPGGKGIRKVKITDPTYGPINNKTILLVRSMGMILDIIMSNDNEDEPFVEALQLCLGNL
eukprot:397524-Ditylum_brightwellii.AAC.1